MHQAKERKSVVLNSQANTVSSIKTLFTSGVYSKDLYIKITWRRGLSIRLAAKSTARRNVTLSILYHYASSFMAKALRGLRLQLQAREFKWGLSVNK